MSSRNLATIARSYESINRPRLERLLQSYRSLPSLQDVIRKAAYALNENGKRHRHQARIKRTAILAAYDTLRRADADISSAPDFDSLYSLIEARTLAIDGIGPLYVYDAALRIGAYLHIEPAAVYIHAGTRKGALRLGIPADAQAVTSESLPSEFARFKAYEIEDLLCIYKDRL